MNTVEQKNIKFINKIIDGTVYKIATGGIGHIQSIKSIDTLNDFIDMTDATIKGNFSSIDDPDVSSSYEVAFITPNGVEIMDHEVIEVIDLIPLEEFKEILIAWRDFLLTPPLNGSKIYQDNKIERSKNRQEINSTESDTVFETTESEISDIELKIYSRQNKFVFILSLVLFVTSFLFFFIIVPSLDVARIIIPVSIVGSIMISLCGFYCLLYYKSWKKDFIEKVRKPKLNIETFILICSLPTALFYFIISWNFLEGPGHNLYKLGITLNVIKFFTS